jgi:putative ABC transport system permease protein
MRTLRALLVRLGGAFGKPRRDRELTDEIESHLQLHIDDGLRAGLTLDEARRHAARQFGGREATKERYRDRRGLPVVETLVQDVRYGWRTFRKNPTFAAVAVLTLALGIGATTAIFSVVYGVLLKPLPYPHADRIVGIWEQRPTGERSSMTTLNYLDYANQSTVFERIAATTGCCGLVTLSNGARPPLELSALRVSSPYFDILGAKAELGRTFVAGDDQPGRDRVVVLSHGLWASEFSSDAALIGQPIRLDREAYTVVGVMPANSPFDRAWNRIWLPLSFGPDRMTRNYHWLISLSGGALGLLKPDVTLERARSEMSAISARIARDYPNSNNGWGVVVDPYVTTIVDTDLRQSLYLLFASVGVVLLIGCFNLANLMLARGLVREREVAIRLALGVSRKRLIQQFLTESLLLSLSGGLVGLVVGYMTTIGLKTALLGQTYNPGLPNVAPAEATIEINASVLIFTLTLSVLTGVAFGLVPALRLSRTAAADSIGLNSKVSAHRDHRLRSALIITEMALSFVLLTSAGLLIRSLFEMQHANTGFDTTNMLTAALPIQENRFPETEQLNRYLQQIVANVQSVPGVRDVALTDGLPLQGVPSGRFFQVAGHPAVDRARRPIGDLKTVSPSYFRTLRLNVREGRGLSDGDRSGSPLVTVINETMARRYFPNENPVGQHLLMDVASATQSGPHEVPWEIVGVISDERLTPFDDKREHAALYLTYEQSPSHFAGLVVRAALPPSAIQESVRKAVSAIDEDQGLTDVKTFEQLKSESMASDRLRSWLLSVFAAMALLLAGIGIYGVIAYSVIQRTHEIGIRAALGATAGALLTLILRRGMTLTVIGLALGWIMALAVTKLFSTFLFGVRSSDPLTLGATAGILAAVAAIACYIPARSATRIDPAVALHAE